MLFSPYKLGSIELKNSIVMAPMTRNRASSSNIPQPIVAQYYAQRASAGLIITEGTSPSPNGVGYPRIPGIYNEEQITAWKSVTSAVHEKGGRIFLQLMHTGRVSHISSLPAGAVILAPSAIKMTGQIYTDKAGMLDYSEPKEMSLAEIESTKDEYVQAAINAMKAGFDGVEIHGANGYMLEQFIAPMSNHRTDEYGGSIENRCRFALEVVGATINAIGKNHVGIRFSPNGAFNDIVPYPEVAETYQYLANGMNELSVLYIHLVDHSSMGTPAVGENVVAGIRNAFKGTLILSGGYDKLRAEKDLLDGKGELIAFGRPFISNPDLVERMESDLELSAPDFTTFYTPGEKGYTDYPAYSLV
jgi:N-ethylmaleimide reductase